MAEAPRNPGVLAFGILSLSAIVVGSALAVGSVHVEVLLCLGASVVLLGSALLLVERSAVRRLPVPALVLMGLSLWSALQALPMPLLLLQKIAPLNADVWARALRPFGEVPIRAGAISLDPGASWVEALKWFVYAVVFTMAHRFGRAASGRAGIAIAFCSAVVVSLVTLAHGLTGATSLYGLYTPELVTPRWGISPILNPNNLSGYLNLGAFCGLGLLLSGRTGNEPSFAATRAVIGTGIAVVIGVSVLGASRGGVLGLGVGIVILAVLLSVLGRATRGEARRRSRSRMRALLPAVIAFGGGCLLAVVGASSATWIELRETSTDKIRLWEWSVPLIRDFPWFGVGRGAFGTVFPAYRGVSGNLAFTHAENFILQWMSEWGVPVAVAALVGLAWFNRPRAAELARDRAKLAAYVGIAVLLLQNLVDLALEIPAVGVLLCAVLGSMYEGPRPVPADGVIEYDARSKTRVLRRVQLKLLGRGSRRLLSYGVFVAGAAAVGLAFAFGRHPVDDERTEMHQLYERTAFAEPGAFAAFLGVLRQAVLRHPAEPYFPLLGALAANRTQGATVLPWVVAALERDVMNARAHMVLASVLMRNHVVDQALMELRFSVQDDPALASQAGQMASRLTRNFEKLDRTAPPGRDGSVMLVAAAVADQPKEAPDFRLKILDLAVARDPTYITARTARAHELFAVASRGSPPCDAASRPDCLARIRDDADAVRRLDPTSCDPLLLKAKLLVGQGDPAGGEALLAAECASCADKVRCLLERVSIASEFSGTESLVTAARAYISVACSNDEQCLGAHVLLGDLFGRRGLWPVAAEHYHEAASKGRKAEWWLRTADASLKAGQVGRASLALLRARRDGAGDAAVQSRIQALQAELAQRETGQR
jgi:hypothetical protein